MEKKIEDLTEKEITKITSSFESALFLVGSRGLTIFELRKISELNSEIIYKILKKMQKHFLIDENRGLLLEKFGNTFKLVTKPSNKVFVSRLFTIKSRHVLSTKTIEVLSIIAYNQPCIKSKIEKVIGTDVSGIIQRLKDLLLIESNAKLEAPGSPSLYTVSAKFYDIFNLKSLNDLPKINFNLEENIDEENLFFNSTKFNE